MQGSGESSLSIWTPFDSTTTALVRTLAWRLRIAWTRVEDLSLSFAIVGTSVVGGTDIVRGISGSLTKPDYFSYYDETDKTVRLEYDRIVEEPLGGMAMTLGDILLDNTDLRFTPNYNSTIGTAIEPNRPIQFKIGFDFADNNVVLPIFKGLTFQPKEYKLDRLCSIVCYDYIQYLNEYLLESTMYQNQRSDQIIEDILNDIGFSSDQYDLDEGLNTIEFAWFEKGDTAGERIRKLAESEDGFFYQDENGILRFENRRHYSVFPHNTIVWTVNENDILDWYQDESSEIYNHCIVKAEPRIVQSIQEIWNDPNLPETVPQGTNTLIIWANFDDPATTITDPVATTDFTANTQADGGGSDQTTKISITITKFAKAAKLEITNTYSGTLYLITLRLRGTPATVSYQITQEYSDANSISLYSENNLEIQNDFIDSDSFAYYIARAVVRKYKDPKKKIRIKVQGIPQLQLKDKIRVKDQDLNTYTNYRVMRIIGQLDTGGFVQELYLREITPEETDAWAIVGTAIVESEDVVSP